MNQMELLATMDFPFWGNAEENEEDGATRMLNLNALFPYPPWFPLPDPEDGSVVVTGSKTTGVVLMNPDCLVRSLMDPVKWKELFPSIVVDAKMAWKDNYPYVVDKDFVASPYPQDQLRFVAQKAAIEIPAQTQIQAEQIKQQKQIYACTQALSPSLSTRKSVFTRSYCDLGNGTSLVFDLPVRSARIDEKVPQLPYLRICLVRPASTCGLSHVVWIELLQFSRRDVHPSLLDLVRDGGGFGSERWYWALSRECRRLAFLGQLFSPVRNSRFIFPTMSRNQGGTTSPKRLMLLAEEMSKRLYLGLSSATPDAGFVALDQYAFTRGHGSWIAAETTWIQAFPTRAVFDSLHAQIQIPFEDNLRNCVSLDLTGILDTRVVRESWYDNSGAMLVTALIHDKSLLNKDDDEEVRFAITVVDALIIHPHGPGSFVTVCHLLQNSMTWDDDDDDDGDEWEDWKRTSANKIDIIRRAAAREGVMPQLNHPGLHRSL